MAVSKRLLQRGRGILRLYKEEFCDEHWSGMAPSHMATELRVNYDTAAEVMLALKEAGYIRHNRNGNRCTLPDGREYYTRYSLVYLPKQ